MELKQDDLRRALQEKIDANREIASHVAMLDEIAKQFPHSVEPIRHPEPLGDFNCVMYALNICPEPPCSPLGRYYADTGYVRSLIDQGQLTEVGDNPPEGSLAIYFKEDTVMHIGRVRSPGRVVSKWGIGNLYEHAPLEVPSSYGNEVRYFSTIDKEKAFELLEQFCRG
ncbi:hypothetical protein ACFQAT_28945 [Undibacterium arcticum]|uniref:DUF7689 domain-containing protein n=1 Tax=Undibacterium arcticum TaxID=1762892 RepID=A0ABV7F5R3_9BURK